MQSNPGARIDSRAADFAQPLIVPGVLKQRWGLKRIISGLPSRLSLTLWCDPCTIWCRCRRWIGEPGPRGRLLAGRVFADRQRGGEAEFLQPVLQRPAGHAQEARRCRDAVSFPERLLKEIPLEGLEGQTGARDLDGERPDLRLLTHLLRQVLEDDLRPLGEEHRPLDRRLELTDVAWPGIFHQGGQGPIVDSTDPLARGRGVAGEKVI